MRNLSLTFDCMNLVKSKGKILQNFVALSEYMNFKPHDSLAYFVLTQLKTNQTVQFFGENARNLLNLKMF